MELPHPASVLEACGPVELPHPASVLEPCGPVELLLLLLLLLLSDQDPAELDGEETTDFETVTGEMTAEEVVVEDDEMLPAEVYVTRVDQVLDDGIVFV